MASESFASSRCFVNNTPGNFLIVSGTAARPAATISISDTAGNVYLPAIGPVTDTVLSRLTSGTYRTARAAPIP